MVLAFENRWKLSAFFRTVFMILSWFEEKNVKFVHLVPP